MYGRTSRRATGVDPASPMSFFAISNLYTIKEIERRSSKMTRDGRDDEVSSSQSSNITALPRWENLRNHRRSRILLPLPARPQRSHVRQNSQAPILASAALEKENLLSFGGPGRSGDQNLVVVDRSVASTPDEDIQNRKSRTVVWLILAIVVLLILAIILGAVLGTMIHPSSSAPQPSVTEIPAGTTPAPTAVPPGDGEVPNPLPTTHLASVAVTGWAVPGSQGYYSVWLFWQNSKGFLSRAAYNSSTGNWTRVSNFAEARKTTPLAAATLNAKYYAGQENYSFSDVKYQTSIVYLDDKNYLKEWIFPDAGPDIGESGALSKQKDMAHEDTNLGFYWPQLVYQGMSGEIRSAYFECHRKDQCWHERVLETTEAKNGTKLVTVPMQSDLQTVGLFYEQEENGRFANYKEDSNQKSRIWENEAYSNLVPENASIAAFSTRRSRDAKDKSVNTYLLWQGDDGTIQMSWTEDEGGWKGPITHPALAGADNNTVLACMTGLTFPGFPLTPGTELARCYFQTGLALREVSFDGESWDIVGVVPIDL